MQNLPSVTSAWLEADFAALAPQLADRAEWKALSILHGVVQELCASRVWKHAADPDRNPRSKISWTSISTRQPRRATRSAHRSRWVSLRRILRLRMRTPALSACPITAAGLWCCHLSARLESRLQSAARPLPTGLEEFQRRGVEAVGISVDGLYSHGAWAAVRGLTGWPLPWLQPRTLCWRPTPMALAPAGSALPKRRSTKPRRRRKSAFHNIIARSRPSFWTPPRRAGGAAAPSARYPKDRALTKGGRLAHEIVISAATGSPGAIESFRGV